MSLPASLAEDRARLFRLDGSSEPKGMLLLNVRFSPRAPVYRCYDGRLECSRIVGKTSELSQLLGVFSGSFAYELRLASGVYRFFCIPSKCEAILHSVDMSLADGVSLLCQLIEVSTATPSSPEPAEFFSAQLGVPHVPAQPALPRGRLILPRKPRGDV